MYCKNCGKELKDNSVFCGNCGTKVFSVEERKSKVKIIPWIITVPVFIAGVFVASKLLKNKGVDNSDQLANKRIETATTNAAPKNTDNGSNTEYENIEKTEIQSGFRSNKIYDFLKSNTFYSPYIQSEGGEQFVFSDNNMVLVTPIYGLEESVVDYDNSVHGTYNLQGNHLTVKYKDYTLEYDYYEELGGFRSDVNINPSSYDVPLFSASCLIPADEYDEIKIYKEWEKYVDYGERPKIVIPDWYEFLSYDAREYYGSVVISGDMICCADIISGDTIPPNVDVYVFDENHILCDAYTVYLLDDQRLARECFNRMTTFNEVREDGERFVNIRERTEDEAFYYLQDNCVIEWVYDPMYDDDFPFSGWIGSLNEKEVVDHFENNDYVVKYK